MTGVETDTLFWIEVKKKAFFDKAHCIDAA